jgi:hypothetical protein
LQRPFALIGNIAVESGVVRHPATTRLPFRPAPIVRMQVLGNPWFAAIRHAQQLWQSLHFGHLQYSKLREDA